MVGSGGCGSCYVCVSVCIGSIHILQPATPELIIEENGSLQTAFLCDVENIRAKTGSYTFPRAGPRPFLSLPSPDECISLQCTDHEIK
jgi:hypothetical protein